MHGPTQALQVVGNITTSGYLKTGGNYAFSAHCNTTSTTATTTSDGGVLRFNVVTYDLGSCFNTATYSYLVPITGMYIFSANCFGNNGASCVITVGTATAMSQQNLHSSVGAISVCTIYQCTAGQYVKVTSYNGYLDNANTNFNGCLLFAT